jgi:hypothetical protein
MVGPTTTVTTVPRRPERRLSLVASAVASASEAIGHPAVRAVRRRAPVYSITSSARTRIDGGIASPSALAVLRFTTISNLVGNLSLSARSRKPAGVAEFPDRAV